VVATVLSGDVETALVRLHVERAGFAALLASDAAR
jgi:hypothetical protein